MQITCRKCGSDSFGAGEIEANPEGGFDVVMPCSKCNTPNNLITSNDPEFAGMLINFFASEPS